MPSSSDEHSADESVVKVAALRKQLRKRAEKQNISHKGPLKAGLPSPAQGKPRSSLIDEVTLLRECEAIYARLPKSSKYAKHKLKVVAKAIELLKRERACRTEEEADKLQQLISSLKLGASSTKVAKAPAAAAEGAPDADMLQTP